MMRWQLGFAEDKVELAAPNDLFNTLSAAIYLLVLERITKSLHLRLSGNK